MKLKSIGQRDYEHAVALKPFYHDGTPRKTWEELPPEVKRNWEASGPVLFERSRS